jgi:hypothetical protein
MWEYGLDSNESEHSPKVGFRKHGNIISGSINADNFLLAEMLLHLQGLCSMELDSSPLKEKKRNYFKLIR